MVKIKSVYVSDNLFQLRTFMSPTATAKWGGATRIYLVGSDEIIIQQSLKNP